MGARVNTHVYTKERKSESVSRPICICGNNDSRLPAQVNQITECSFRVFVFVLVSIPCQNDPSPPPPTLIHTFPSLSSFNGHWNGNRSAQML